MARFVRFGMLHTVMVDGPAIPLSEDGEPLLQLRSLHGEERLSEVYVYTLELVTPSEPEVTSSTASNIDLNKMIGRSLTITIELDGMERTYIGAGKREISGLVFRARYLGQEDRRGRYEVIVKPWMALAQSRTDVRIFQRKSALDIVRAVLGHYPFGYVRRTSERYPTLDYQVQFNESDYTFIQRIMQENGLYWFYEHKDHFHTMIIVDSPGGHRKMQSEAYHSLPYYPPERRLDTEHIDRFDIEQSWQPGIWTTSDYDFKKPKANLTTQQQQPQQTALRDIETYEWPGDYTEVNQGNTFASIRMQEIHARGLRAYGHGNLRDMECGTLFELTDYPQKEANRSYLVIAAGIAATEIGDTTGKSDYSFETTFEVQPEAIRFRPERTIAKPRTSGPQTAVVTGPSGSEIYTDEYGRIKVKFQWDREGTSDQNSSCWMRVMYPWAGPNYGSIHVPRVGTEVVVDFINGDPDRPVVVGQMYNAASMPPWNLPANATQSGVLTRSSKNGGTENANAIRFEDRKGEEQLWLHAEKDMLTEVENNNTNTVGDNETTTIAANRTETVGANQNETVKGIQILTVDLCSIETIGLVKLLNVGLLYAINVGGAMNTIVGASSSEEVGLWKNTLVGQSYNIRAGERIALKADNARAFITLGKVEKEDQPENPAPEETSKLGEGLIADATTPNISVNDVSTITKQIMDGGTAALGKAKAGTDGPPLKGDHITLQVGKSQIRMDGEGIWITANDIWLQGKVHGIMHDTTEVVWVEEVQSDAQKKDPTWWTSPWAKSLFTFGFTTIAGLLSKEPLGWSLLAG